MSDLNIVKVYRTLNEAQQQRIQNHKASVTLGKDGILYTREEEINIAGKGTKTNKLVSIIPQETEKKVSFKEADYLFRDLVHMNVILTNACNLNCSYCYEQHNKDFGRFTTESLKKSYDWLSQVNNNKKKVFQFFGGEPLIHKKLIKEFIETHDKELESNYENYRGTHISMCSNGLLLDDEFIEFYFGKSYTHMLISLDTLNTEIDHREITKEQLDKIVYNIEKITKTLDEPQRLVIRATLSEETAPHMEEFIDTLYEKGVRSIIVHPLVLDSRRGFIKWEDKNWQTMRDQIFKSLNQYKDLYIKFSEGVGMKSDNNCMIGSDMIAIDASGDFSGCYFFTNQKSNGADIAILGNIFNDSVYIDRYKNFQKAYAEMFEVEEQCKSCDYQDACYQCPAGNLDTGSKLFRPDDMCQKIVKLYLDFQKDVSKKQFNRLVEMRHERLKSVGEKVLAAEIAYFSDVYYGNYGNKLDHYLSLDLPHYQTILGNWLSHLKDDKIDLFNDTYEKVELDTFFKMANNSNRNIVYPKIENDYLKCFYIQCISTLIFNTNRINQVKLSTLLV